MASKEQWGYWRGVLLPSIVEGCGVPDGDRGKYAEYLHEQIKQIYGVTSFYRLTADEMQKAISYTHMIFAREFGVMLPEPGEPSIRVLNRMGMKTFLSLQKDLYAKTDRSDPDKGGVERAE